MAGFQYTKLFAIVEIDVDTDAASELIIKVDRPGDDMHQVLNFAFNTEATTTGRRTVTVSLPGSTRGRLFQPKITSQGVLRLYGMRVYAKVLDGGGKTSWRWYTIPVVPTQEDWQTFPLPIPRTQEGWESAQLPIRPTPKEASWVPLPMDK